MPDRQSEEAPLLFGEVMLPAKAVKIFIVGALVAKIFF